MPRRHKADIQAARHAAQRSASYPTAPCLDCGRPSVTLYCDTCAPPVRRSDPTGDRRWNGATLIQAVDYQASR